MSALDDFAQLFDSNAIAGDRKLMEGLRISESDEKVLGHCGLIKIIIRLLLLFEYEFGCAGR